ncbi:MAG TPA: hypothetical protein GXX36_15480 [Clostridiaceae bacterium]|nr:hypothetical protein [Clostridiaceae bacterium]
MDGFVISNKNREWYAPWTYELFRNFENKYGYSLVERLPELFLKAEGKSVSQMMWHYMELLQKMFLDNFIKPIYE